MAFQSNSSAMASVLAYSQRAVTDVAITLSWVSTSDVYGTSGNPLELAAGALEHDQIAEP